MSTQNERRENDAWLQIIITTIDKEATM